MGKKFWLFLGAYEIPDNLMDYSFVKERHSALLFGIGVDRRRHYADQHYNLAMIAYEEKDPAREEAEYENALESNPEHARSLENLGVLAIEKKQYERAESLFDRARRLPNPSAKSWSVWGSLRERRGDSEGARLGCEKALEIDPAFAHNT